MSPVIDKLMGFVILAHLVAVAGITIVATAIGAIPAPIAIYMAAMLAFSLVVWRDTNKKSPPP